MAVETRFPNSDMKERWEIMNEALRVCTHLAMRAFAEGYDLQVEYKPDGSKVTELDVALNEKLIELIKQHLPQDTVLGEEVKYLPAQPNGFVWLHDPIDGTSGFVRNSRNKTPGLCTSAGMIALIPPGQKQPCMAGVDRISDEPETYALSDWSNWGVDMPEAYRVRTEVESLAQVERYDWNHWDGAELDLRRLDAHLPKTAKRIKISSLGIMAGRVATGLLDFAVFPGPRSNPHDYVPSMYLLDNNPYEPWVTNLDGETIVNIDCLRPTNGVILASSQHLGAELLELCANL
ncbi:hypothetical protein KC878_01525 [Candidatus Saccharibacteria bacterium]|nr:hypothetical protein [Candidatus Saccharibacteria bacterium]MCB9821206.1 hypothetical protein [Candidatus Nomurabacteria bacterium]